MPQSLYLFICQWIVSISWLLWIMLQWMTVAPCVLMLTASLYDRPLPSGLVCYCDLFFFFFLIWLPHMACRILVPRPGFEPPPLTASARSPSHWTARDFLVRSSKSLLSFVLLIRPHMQAFLQLPNTNWNENLITALPDPTILGGSLFYIWNRIFMIPPLHEGYQSILVKWVKHCLVGSFASLELIFVLQLVFTGLQL